MKTTIFIFREMPECEQNDWIGIQPGEYQIRLIIDNNKNGRLRPHASAPYKLKRAQL